MPDVSNPPGLTESGDVDHDQTSGGTSGNPHADSAATADVSTIQSSGDVDHQETTNRTHNGDDISPNGVDANTVSASGELGNPAYPTLSDVPTNLPEGTQVYVEDENAIYVEDGA